MSTATPLERNRPERFSISEIVRLASAGKIRVPTFQRHFAWQAEDVRDLFDSIYRGFPVGTLLLWQHRADAGTVHLGPISLNVPSDPSAYSVVDGQQRITALVATLNPEYAGVDDRFDIYFDLQKEKFGNSRKGKIPMRSIPVREALETRTLLQWIRSHADELDEHDLNVADRLGGALRDYEIPAYVVAGENLDVLREVFDRVNSAGKPISRAQVFHALFAGSDDPTSPTSVVENLQKTGFGRLDEGRVVQSLLALRGGDVQRDIRDEFNSPNDDPGEWFDLTEVALQRTIEFLRSRGVPHLLLMPNTLPIPILATFFHLHPHPEPWTKRLLARWMWRGWVHDFGREGGQTPVLRRAIRAVNPDFSDPGSAPSEYDAVKSLLKYTPDRAIPSVDFEKFNTKNANSRLIMLALASRGPRDANGQLIEIDKQLETYGSDAVTTFVPRSRTIAAARGFWTVDSPPITEISNQAILESHLIDKESFNLLSMGRTDGFLEARGKSLHGFVKGFLDSRVEPGKSARPPLQQLAIDDAGEMSSE